MMNLNKVAELAASPFQIVHGQAAARPEEGAATASPEAAMTSSAAGGGIAKRWRELHGEHSWNGLLDPLDIDLRRSIISYGELAQATYDGFNTERRSPHIGACMYGYDDLLQVSGVTNARHYKITKFIYATSTLPLPAAFLLLPLAALKDVWSRESNFIGYVAVATDEGAAALGRRDIVVAWRGTIRPIEWTKDLDVTPASAAPVLGPAASGHPLAMVHNGFLSLYTSSNADSKFNKTSARDQVLEEVRRLMDLYKDEEISVTVTGHSLGAALATLNAVDMAANVVKVAPANASTTKPSCLVTAIVFACPHVGNIFFRTAYRSLREHLKSLHIMNFGDIVPTVPLISYVDVHVPLSINSDHSPFVRPLPPRPRHNLELYLHCLAGHQGSAGGFKLEVERDTALLNKDDDLLKDEYPVPGKWFIKQHKGMVKNAEGKWELRDFKQF